MTTRRDVGKKKDVPLLASDWRLAGEGWTVGEAGRGARCTSGTLVHAHEQLHPHSDAGVPPQRQQADVASHNRWAQQVLHSGGSVRVPIKHLREHRQQTFNTTCQHILDFHFSSHSFHCISLSPHFPNNIQNDIVGLYLFMDDAGVC